MFNFFIILKMKRSELFRILDACEPKVSDVIAYLKKFSVQSPFDLVFVKDGIVFSTRTIKVNQGALAGVKIGKFLLYAKTITQKAFAEEQISKAEVFEAAIKIAPRAKPLDGKLLRILKKNQAELASLTKTLQDYGYDDASSWDKEMHMIFESPSPAAYADYYKKFSIAGAIGIREFLENNNPILVYREI